MPNNRLDCLDLGGKPVDNRSRFSSEQDYDLPEPKYENEAIKEETTIELPNPELFRSTSIGDSHQAELNEYNSNTFWRAEISVDEFDDV